MTEIYHAALMALAKSAHGHGRLAVRDATATLDNPLCGDRVTIDVAIAGGRVDRVTQEVKGCALCQASASAIGAAAPGQEIEGLRVVAAALRAFLQTRAPLPEAAWSALAAFAPVAERKSRHDCVLLPFDALLRAIDAALARAAGA
ncbi:MAG: iron-sulfur cluster assembly scaffold protein [Alphaproteobacteria bacterium]|nr:iron-sulfur cluster assembly scaffold protein [Alphaproteobacteria bacterium]